MTLTPTASFNIYRLESLCTVNAIPEEHGRRDYYKISLIRGNKQVNYGTHSFEISGTTLIFFKPDTPYSMITQGAGHSGFYCVFPPSFFESYVNIEKYPLFQDIENAHIALDAQQEATIMNLFLRMEEEFHGEYAYKFDAIRNCILELMHYLLRTKTFTPPTPTTVNASVRLATSFADMLEKQFPIDSIQQQLSVRSPKDYAAALNVHVNYLNKVLQDVTGQSTTALIKGRIIKEARAMLRFTDWTINQIAWCLGYEDPSNFITVFKKATTTTPNDFRRNHLV